MIVVSWFSRWREYHADQGGAALTGKGKMIAALEALQRAHGAPRDDAPAMASMKISGGGMMAMFSTHPPLEERIARLRGDR
jgi:heat shock protein HtpX